MNASSYLEGFLTVYGWMLYDTLYQLFSMLWLVFLPFMMLAYNYFREVSTDDFYGSYGYFKSNFFNFIVMLLVLMFCVIPVDKISIKESRINTVCTKGEAITNIYEGKKGAKNGQFTFDVEQQGKVPILPSIVMRLAQGTNNVIYNTTPCVENVTNLAIAFDSSKVNDPELVGNMNTFVNQCYRKARERFQNFARSAGDEAANQLAESFAKEYVERKLGKKWDGWFNGVSEKGEIIAQKKYMGSELMQFLMEPHSRNIGFKNDNVKKAFNQVAIGPLYSDGTVTKVSGNSADASSYQQQTGTGPVKCSTWWAELKPKLEKDSMRDLATHALIEDKKRACQGHLGIDESCVNRVKEMYNMDRGPEYNAKVRQLLLQSQYTSRGNVAMSNSEQKNLDTVASVAVIGSVVGFIPGMGNNFLSSLADSAVAFYGEMFMYKVIMKFLQPMLLMGIYAFWGIYLIVSSYRGEVVFKGLVLIYAVTLLPSMWAIADHLDGHLFQAMFPYNDVTNVSTRGSSTVERMVLDGAITVFYIILPMFLLYLISEAGGPKGDRGMQSTDSQAKNIGRGTSNIGKGNLGEGQKSIRGWLGNKTGPTKK